MAHELKVPEVGESIREVQIGQWLKQEGDWVEKDENVVEIDTDKASVELAAPVAGIVSKILKQEGEEAEVGDVIGYVEASEQPSEKKGEAAQRKAEEAEGGAPSKAAARAAAESPDGGPVAERNEVEAEAEIEPSDELAPAPRSEPPRVMPAAERLLAEHGLRAEEVRGTGPGGRLLKEDVERHVDEGRSQQREPEKPKARETMPRREPPAGAPAEAEDRAEQRRAEAPSAPSADRQEEVVPMTLIRRRIAERLVEAQQTAALLTTFNEIDMTAVIELRKKYRDRFQERHGVKLGFMSFFVKTVIEALKQYPEINAEIRGRDIVYRNYYDIGIAVGGPRGLVVPVLRNAERLSFAEVEQQIGILAARARDNKLKPDDLEGGTFTISNGGIYGSLLSTPIVNPPQSGILGLHAIQERPIAIDGQAVVRPMMYVALTYDHRIVDGQGAVGFLRHVKEIVEDPARLMLEI